MQGKHLYEYAVVRLVPKVEREEFMNVGLILFSKRVGFIKMLYEVDKEKLKVFSPDTDLDEVYSNLEAFEKICLGVEDGGAIARLDVPERFRWLTAMKSSCIQTSRPHPGFSDDLEKTTRLLFEELVL
ncbi:DUF3037 domain-containing protein [Dysgonomonas sp. 520]|uniref:DUF3037 domain-containing protein n=1 Tax=Dysgonomonas sp. 520 TaxID=2302931 RepID=UPI0013D8536A|nr:DUF3037 domain-containing protein [Dysgonomonas sp. 520]NDW09754.1 DUF3037 domain-containing protein [Dysgonomonas sp. 520]